MCRVFDSTLMTSLESEGLTALSTAAASRVNAFASCYDAVQEHSNYIEIFLLKDNECYISDSVAFM